jgi:predicted metallopeptidase
MRFLSIAAVTALGFCALSLQPLLAQTATSGTWTLSPSRQAGSVRLQLSFHELSSDNSDSMDLPPASLGLTPADLASPGKDVQFRLVREAGTFTCNGRLASGKGGGDVSFAPDAAFRDKMRMLGYDISPRQQLTAALIDITTGYVAELKNAGFANIPFETLVPLRAMQVDGAYAASMRSLFPDVTANQLIPLRAMKVSAAYIAEMRSSGVSVKTSQAAISLEAMHVDPAYVKSIAALGYNHLSTDDLVRLRAMHIDAAYIERVRSHGLNSSIEDLVRLKAMNVVSP